MALNTAKTTLGFMRSVAARWLPFLRSNQRLEDIYNYRAIEGLYSTSGQPEAEQFELIREAGFETVINLAPKSLIENSLRDEAEVLADLGLAYVHIPVDFQKPTDDDFRRFVETLEENDESRVWVHCAANARVSAFTYRYRRDVKGVDEARAREDLEAIWTPFGVCKAFISRTTMP